MVGVSCEPAVVTVIDADTAVRPTASRARAASVCAPGATVLESQLIVYGSDVTSAPSGAPSSRNWTPATLLSSDAFAARTTLEPDTGPAAGAVIDTVGAVMSTATVTVLDPVAFVESRATAVRKCVPLVAALVFQVIEYGADVSSAPRATPSSRN